MEFSIKVLLIIEIDLFKYLSIDRNKVFLYILITLYHFVMIELYKLMIFSYFYIEVK